MQRTCKYCGRKIRHPKKICPVCGHEFETLSQDMTNGAKAGLKKFIKGALFLVGVSVLIVLYTLFSK